MKTENTPCQLKSLIAGHPGMKNTITIKWTLKMCMSDFFSDKTSKPSFWAQQQQNVPQQCKSLPPFTFQILNYNIGWFIMFSLKRIFPSLLKKVLMPYYLEKHYLI